MNFANAAVGQYMPGESLMHRLDPRTKMLVSLGIVIVLFVVSKSTGICHALRCR